MVERMRCTGYLQGKRSAGNIKENGDLKYNELLIDTVQQVIEADMNF